MTYTSNNYHSDQSTVIYSLKYIFYYDGQHCSFCKPDTVADLTLTKIRGGGGGGGGGGVGWKIAFEVVFLVHQ